MVNTNNASVTVDGKPSGMKTHLPDLDVDGGII
jgi:hypothetical protein